MASLHGGSSRSNGCSSYFEGPIFPALGENLGYIYSADNFEISFDIMGLNNYCLSEYCYIISIGITCPAIYIATNLIQNRSALRMDMVYDEILYQYPVIMHPEKMNIIFQDSKWHHFYFQSLSFADYGFESTIIKIDNSTYNYTKLQYYEITVDNVTYINPTIWAVDNSTEPDSSCLIYTGRHIPYPFADPVNATIRNLCIKIPSQDVTEPFTVPSSFPTISPDTTSLTESPSMTFRSNLESDQLSTTNLIAIGVGMSVFIVFCCIVVAMCMIWKWHFPNYSSRGELEQSRKKEYVQVDTKETGQTTSEIKAKEFASTQLNDALFEIYLQSEARCIAECKKMGLSLKETESLFVIFSKRKHNPLLDD